MKKIKKKYQVELW